MIKTDLKIHLRYTEGDIKAALASLFPLESCEILEVRVVKQSLDLSDTYNPHYKLTVAFSLSAEREAGLLKYRNRVFSYTPPEYVAPVASLDFRPVVVGAGPAGLFAALVLAEAGARPIVLERGLDVDGRLGKIKTFNITGVLDPECNVQFGEGGAGAYSDGKLKVGSMNSVKMKILSELVAAGAEPSILFSDMGHVGTDKLVGIIKRIREKAVSLGAEFIFGARFTAVYSGECLCAVKYVKEGKEECISTQAAILAVGHSARDTVRSLYADGMVLTPKSFGIGVRVEHPREYINRIVYKHAYGTVEESASYHLVTHLKGGRSVYSFCMCPGGTVVAATGNVGSVVTNGMSEYARNAENSNAAILVSVTPDDFGTEGALGGILLQEKIEGRAFSLTDSYRAPSQSLDSLFTGNLKMGGVLPSYPRGTECIDINEYMPAYVAPSITEAIIDFDKWLPGYNLPGAVITGPETRTTSPVRMERDNKGVAIGKSGLFPAGEGAGYAGGIVSSAADGILQAENLIKFHQK